MPHHKVICTAGHIDHGKTSLTRALTGMETDRLAEEQARGITIDMGFAYYRDDVTIIDLPGHERFIRNMAAGAATVDFALLVVAADDGPMPQTREHLDILNLLGIKDGLIVITKVDMVEEEWAELVAEEVKEMCEATFLTGKDVILTDSVSGKGIEELKKRLDEELDSLPPRQTRPEFRCPVDRSFTIKGFGTVTTGTAISGRVKLKDSIQHLPSGKIFKIRGIQIHGKDCEYADTGTRAALNLSGAEKSEIVRGDILAVPGLLKPSSRWDCKVELLESAEPLKHRQRLRFHIGTAEIIGRILLLEDNWLNPGCSMAAQLELEAPVAALRGDRFVFRTYSPQSTIGGGMILMSADEKHKRRRQPLIDKINALAEGEPAKIVSALTESAGEAGISLSRILFEGGLEAGEGKNAVKELSESGKLIVTRSGGEDWYISISKLALIFNSIHDVIVLFHRNNPSKPGLTLAELKSSLKYEYENPFIDYALKQLTSDGRVCLSDSLYAHGSFSIQLNKSQKQQAEKIVELITSAGLQPTRAHPIAELLNVPVEEILDLLAIMESMGTLVRLETDAVISVEAFNEAGRILKGAFGHRQFSLPEAVEALNAGRRTAVIILEYMDKSRFTERIGDERRVR